MNGIEEDEAAHKRSIEDEAKSWLATPGDVELQSLSHWEDTDSPIEATLKIRMANFASAAGSRLLVPTRVFDTGYRRAFDHKDRKYPIYYDYPFLDMEEVRIHMPHGMKVESVPERRLEKSDFAAYLLDRKASTDDTIVLKRQLIVGGILFPVEMYPKMKTFFDGLKTHDDEQIILKSTEASALTGGADVH